MANNGSWFIEILQNDKDVLTELVKTFKEDLTHPSVYIAEVNPDTGEKLPVPMLVFEHHESEKIPDEVKDFMQKHMVLEATYR